MCFLTAKFTAFTFELF